MLIIGKIENKIIEDDQLLSSLNSSIESWFWDNWVLDIRYELILASKHELVIGFKCNHKNEADNHTDEWKLNPDIGSVELSSSEPDDDEASEDGHPSKEPVACPD